MKYLYMLMLLVCFTGIATAEEPTTNDYEILAPNVFTPNGDGQNDFFVVSEKGGKQEISLKVYTRSGSLVYQQTDRICVWDGREQLTGEQMSEGVYYYVAMVSGSKTSKMGFFHLYR